MRNTVKTLKNWPSEHQIQSAFHSWFSRAWGKRVIGFAIENAQNVSHGVGSVMKRKARGVRAGVSDYFIAQPVGKHAGLFLEFKTATGTVQLTQKLFGKEVQNVGYLWFVVRSFEEAQAITEKYLTGGFSK